MKLSISLGADPTRRPLPASPVSSNMSASRSRGGGEGSARHNGHGSGQHAVQHDPEDEWGEQLRLEFSIDEEDDDDDGESDGGPSSGARGPHVGRPMTGSRSAMCFWAYKTDCRLKLLLPAARSSSF